jgi:hypothetical protein
MKLRQIAILILLTVAALLAAIHPPNPNTECARPGCGHRHFNHFKGNGPCEYSDPYVPVGHCPGFVHAK